MQVVARRGWPQEKRILAPGDPAEPVQLIDIRDLGGWMTVRDTLAWDLARGRPEPGQEGLSREREEDLLRLLR